MILSETHSLKIPEGSPAPWVFAALVAAFELIVAACSHSFGMFFAAAGAAGAATVLYRRRRRESLIRATPEGIEIPSRKESVRWSEIESVVYRVGGLLKPKSRAASCAVTIYHSRGALVLPKSGGGFSTATLISKIIEKSGISNRAVGLPSALAEAYRESVETFGTQAVFTTIAEPREFSRPGAWEAAGFFGIFVMLGVLAACLPGGDAGVIVLFCHAFIAFIVAISLLPRRGMRSRRMFRGSALMMDPWGLFIEGRTTCAKLDWRDLRGVGETPGVSASGSERGLILKMRGVDFVLNDIYRCPLSEVRRRLLVYHAAAHAGQPPSPSSEPVQALV